VNDGLAIAVLEPAVLIGATYALLAVGYAVAYSSMNIVNFAHGEVMMAGAVAGYLFLDLEFVRSSVPGVLAFVTAIAIGGLVGAGIAFLIQRVLYRPLRDRGRLALVLSALGASIFLQQVGQLILRLHGTGSSERRLEIRDDSTVGRSSAAMSEMAGLILLIASLFALVWLVQKTPFGIRLRAIAFSPEAMRRLKQPVDTTIGWAFAVGGLVAGAAGVVYAKQYTLTPYMGFLPGMKAFLACIVGGRSIQGAVLGGFAIGMTEGILSGYVGADWRDIVTGILIVAMLLYRPDGLFATPRPRTL